MPEHHRVVRGGAFNNNDRNLRCAYRNNNDPNNRNNNIGFRVVVSTLFLLMPKCPCALGTPKGSWLRPFRKMAGHIPGRLSPHPALSRQERSKVGQI
jgi:hypothetical protein